LVAFFQIFFALDRDKKELRIRALKGLTELVLISHTLLLGDFPRLLIDEHVHWLNLNSRQIEFRPLEDKWTSSQENWNLYISETISSARMSRHLNGEERKLLVDLGSPTFGMISRRLKPLEQEHYLMVTYDLETLRVTADLPRFRLQFGLVDNELESLNLREMVIDDVQSASTMIGLRNQLILRPKLAPAGNPPQPRSVLIPRGNVKVFPSPHHVHVEVETGTTRHAHYYEYKIEEDLGYLAINADLTSRLYKIYLHAVTSHCLPDILTGRTGTEEALDELSSGAAYSFQQLTLDDVELLVLIGSLTPTHSFYPPNSQKMHSAGWSTPSPLAEHPAFAAGASSILEYAKALQIFGANSVMNLDASIQKLKRNPFLIARHAHRAARYYPCDATSSPFSQNNANRAADHLYCSPRDLEDVSVGFSEPEEPVTYTQLVTWASHITWSSSGFTPNTFQLHQRTVDQWGSIPVKGPSTIINLGYNPEWLTIDFASSWISLYDLCRKDQDVDVFRLLFAMSTMVYGQPSLRDFVPILAGVSKTPHFRQVAPPSWSSYVLSDGFTPSESLITDIVYSHAHSLDDTPTTKMDRAEDEGDIEFYTRQNDHYNTEIQRLAATFVDSLLGAHKAGRPLSAPTYQHTLWFDTLACIQDIRGYFTSCQHNSELLDHIAAVDSILETRFPSRPTIITTRPPLALPRPGVSDNIKLPLVGITVYDLLSRPVDIPPSFLAEVIHEVHPATESPKESFASAVNQLKYLIKEIKGKSDGLHRSYGGELEQSLERLLTMERVTYSHYTPSSMALKAYRDYNQNRYLEKLQNIRGALLPSYPSARHERLLAVSGLWPRISIRIMLKQLSLQNRDKLSIQIRESITDLARAFLNYQQAQRLVALACRGNARDFAQELLSNKNEAGENLDQLLIEVIINHLILC
jgi:hypothetical protein